MRLARSQPIRVSAQAALAAAVLFGVVPAAIAQSTEHLIIGFASGASQAVPLSPVLTVAIALALAMTAFVVLRRRTVRGGRLFGWLLAVSAATLAVVGGERAISDAHAITVPPPPPAINLSTSPASLDLMTWWQADIDPLTVTVTNTTSQTVRISSVTTDNTDLYILSTPTTCTVGTVLAPNAQCTVTLSIQ